MMQIGQTEPVGETRRRTKVRRVVKFVQNTRQYKIGIRHSTNPYFILPCVVCAFFTPFRIC